MFTELEDGFTYKDQNILVFFGKKTANLDKIRSLFPELTFKRIRQVHGTKIISTSPHSIDFSVEADAHYTFDRSLSLCINTADCMPIFIFDPKSSSIFSIHAGWRGVQQQIHLKALEILKKKNKDLPSIQVFIGPHIKFESFEVGEDVKDLLVKPLSGTKPELIPFKSLSADKFLVDLKSIVVHQLEEMGLNANQIYSLDLNTFRDERFHSYRRDKEDSGRQISFIVKL
jgi:YfiH family protein